MVAEAFRKNIPIREIYKKSKIDKWFLEQIKEIVDTEKQIVKSGLPKTFQELNYIKSIGFSDKKLSELTNKKEEYIRNIR